MKLLLLNQFYPPDPAPTGQYLHDLGKVLVERGHQVRVLCSRRSYGSTETYPERETRDGVEIIRLPATGFGRRGFIGKLVDYGTFYGSLFTSLLSRRGKADVILSLTTPPYVGLLGKWAACRHGARHAHWIMDLYPDVMFAHGMARNDGLLFRMLQKLTRYQLRGSQFALALGPIMAEKVANYLQHSTLNLQRPLWSNSKLSPWLGGKPNPLRAERGWTENEPVFLYSGNMGLGHRFQEFLEAAKRLGPTGPRWVFAGDGKRRAEVVAFAKSNSSARIEVLGYAPSSQLQAHLCSADVHLASLDPSWQGLMVPSKLQGSFAVGKPVLYVGSRQCETAAWIQQSGGGWTVAENDIDGLIHAVKEASDPNRSRERGLAAWRFSQAHFQMTKNCAQIAELLENNGH